MESLTNKEINKLIHEKIFGECWHDWRDVEENDVRLHHECQRCKKTTKDYFEYTKVLPDYCTSIADAWRVVEKMESGGWIWTFSKNTNEFAAKYDVRFFLMNERRSAPEKKSIAIEETPQRAICLAALQAVSD